MDTSTIVILLQIVLVSPGTHLMKDHESQSRTNESQNKSETEKLGPLYNKTVNLKTDFKTVYNSALKLKYSLSFLKHNKRIKDICIVKQQP